MNETAPVEPKHPVLQTRVIPSDNILIEDTQASNSIDKRKIRMKCAEQRITDQRKEVKIRKHNQYHYCKSMVEESWNLRK